MLDPVLRPREPAARSGALFFFCSICYTALGPTQRNRRKPVPKPNALLLYVSYNTPTNKHTPSTLTKKTTPPPHPTTHLVPHGGRDRRAFRPGIPVLRGPSPRLTGSARCRIGGYADGRRRRRGCRGGRGRRLYRRCRRRRRRLRGLCECVGGREECVCVCDKGSWGTESED